LADIVPIFRGSSGLNNRIDPARIRFDSETYIQELAVAVNVVVDDSYRLNRRKGQTTTDITSSCHSLFPYREVCMAVVGSNLCVLDDGLNSTPIATVNPDARMSYETVSELVYYCNGHQNGVINLDTMSRSDWEKVDEDYVGPITSRQFQSPVVGYMLAYYKGRLYMVTVDQGFPVVWYTEPNSFNWVDFAQNYLPFESRVTMFRPVRDGIFVSTEAEVFFLSGDDPVSGFEHIHISDYPAIEGTDVIVPGSRIGKGDIPGEVVLWTTEQGVCMGATQGYFNNITDRRIRLPSGFNRGSAVYYDGGYTVTLY
jgi:hypothetical protein